MMKRILAASAALAISATLAHAQEVKVGVNLPYTGIGAELAQWIDRGMEMYLKLNADKVKPYKITLVKRDAKNPGGNDSRVATQELLTQDNVDILAGWVYSPNAIASAPVVTAGKKFAVIMNAGTAHITQMSNYYTRVSFSMWHAGFAIGEAAAKQLKAKTAVVGYSDFPPGKDSLAAFKRSFEANGGKVIDEIPMGGAGAVPDFTPFFQRVKDQKPDVFFVFVPAGDHAAAVARTYGALGMKAAGIKLIGPGDITQDTKLQAMGDAAVGMITMHHYNADLDNAENKRFVAAWKKEYGAEFDAGLHGGRRLRRHGAHRPCRAAAQRQGGGWRQGDRSRQDLQVRQPARPDLDRPGNPRHRHERVSVRSREGQGRQAAPEGDRQDRQREGCLQGAEDRALQVGHDARSNAAAPAMGRRFCILV